MQVNLTWTTPTTRVDGSPLALSDIQATNVIRDGSVIASPVAVAGTNNFADTSAAVGSHDYTVVTVTAEGESAPSNVATAVIVPPVLGVAAAITDLVATVAP